MKTGSAYPPLLRRPTEGRDIVADYRSLGLTLRSHPLSLLRRWREYTPHAVKILTWAGVRGGISVALALSLPPGPARQVFLPMPYVIVLFSLLVQGLSLGRVVRRAGVAAAPDATA